MKTFSLILLALILAGTVYAEGKGKARAFMIDPDIDTESLEQDFEVESSDQGQSSLPDKDERDDFLSGISQVKDWDEWDKDVFYMYLHSKNLDQLEKKYPMFTRAELQKLKEKRQ